jgi:hypothetical protein
MSDYLIGRLPFGSQEAGAGSRISLTAAILFGNQIKTAKSQFIKYSGSQLLASGFWFLNNP